MRWPSGALALLLFALPVSAQADPDDREAGSETAADIPDLIAKATRGNWNTRIKAVHALGRMGSIDGLSEGVTDGDWQIRLTAVHWLGRQGDAGVPTLAHVIRSEPCRVIRLAAIHWLGSIGPTALPALRETLGESSPMIRLTSAYWIRKIEAGDKSDDSAPSPEDPNLLHGASQEDLRGCEEVNLPPKKVTPLPFSSEEDEQAAAQAFKPPVNNSPLAEQAVAQEAKPTSSPGAAATEKEKRERTEALRLLAEAQPPRRAEEDEEDDAEPTGAPRKTPPGPALASLPGSQQAPLPAPPSMPVKPAEKPLPDLATIGRISSGTAPSPQLAGGLPGEPQQKFGPVPTWHLVEGGKSPNYDISLREPQPGRPAHDPLPDLIKALRSTNARHRYRSADILGMMGAEAAPAVGDLIAALKDKNAAVRASCALALGNIGRAAGDSVPALTRLLRDSNADVRYSAAVALGRMGTPAADRAFQRYVRAEAARMIDGR